MKNESHWTKAHKNHTRKKLLKNTLATIAIAFITGFTTTLLILTLT